MNSVPNTSPLLNLFNHVSRITLLGHEALTIEDLLQKSLQEILELLDAKRGAIFFIDANTRELILRCSVGLKADEQGHIIECLRDRVIVPVEKLKKSSRVPATSSYKSFICTPILIKDELIGIISVGEKSSNKNFLSKELQLLEFVSAQLAINIKKISLSQELKETAAQVNSLKKQIESQERLVSLGKLAGGIAHEFNNPLDGVMRYTNLCLSQVQDDDVLREYLTEIQQGLKRMANIVRNLLACARNSPRSAHKIDINIAIEQSLKELYPYLASKNINLVKNFTSELPQITDLGFERIINNLVKNAIDATDPKGVIQISTSLEEEYLKIQISDNGKGISSQDLARIYEPFFTTKDIDKGCGLGLTIVNEIVKYYNGRIKVKSRPGEGTTFTVRVPFK